MSSSIAVGGTSPEKGTEPPGLSSMAPGVVVLLVMLAVMWVLEVIDLLPGVSLDRWGIRPRELGGLTGIATAPFLHIGFGHLIANTLPFLVLGGVIALSGLRQFVETTIIIAVVGGLGVWLFGGGNSVHLGASGLIFGYITYLISRGAFARRVTWIVGGVIVAVFYGGSLVWGVFPNGRMSWQGHLFGAIGGVVAAWVLHGDHDLDEDPAPA
jgi:membrane associated rhomboid family serine protease